MKWNWSLCYQKTFVDGMSCDPGDRTYPFEFPLFHVGQGSGFCLFLNGDIREVPTCSSLNTTGRGRDTPAANVSSILIFLQGKLE